MAVTITTGEGASYTWGGSAWDWTDVRASKSWDTAFASSYNVTEADNAPNFAGLWPKGMTALRREAFATASAAADVVSFLRTWASAFSTIESYTDNINWLNAIEEVVSFAENLRKAADRRNLLEAFSTAEVLRKASGKAHLAEAFATAGAQADVVAFRRTFAGAFNAASVQTDVVAFSRSFASSLTTAEANAKQVTNRENESVAVAEAFADVAAFTRTFAEALGTAELLSKSPTKGVGTSFAVAEAHADIVAFVRAFASAVSFTEAYFDNINWLNAIDEALAFGVVRPKSATRVNREAFAAIDALRKGVINVEPETIAFAETYIDLIDWIQANLESFQIAEAAPTTIAKRILRSMSLRDMFLRNATGVYGDLSVRSAATTAAQFAALVASRHPEGYDDFKQYLPGDYRFEKALIDIALVPTDAAAQTLSLQSAKTSVDVPDVNDRGSGTVGVNGTSFTFARTFYVAPEIRVQQTGGALPAVAVVSSVTTTGFVVRLYDAANPTQAVSGSISWSALGY